MKVDLNATEMLTDEEFDKGLERYCDYHLNSAGEPASTILCLSEIWYRLTPAQVERLNSDDWSRYQEYQAESAYEMEMLSDMEFGQCY